MIPKLYSSALVKVLIKTGLFNLLFSKYCRMIHTSVKDALDELSDNEEFKAVLCYIFGDMGTCYSFFYQISFDRFIHDLHNRHTI